MEPSAPLLTFARVPAYLHATGRAVSASPAGDLVQCRIDDASVPVLVAMRPLRTAAGSEWLALSVPLGPVAPFRLRAALVAIDALPLGVLADWQGLMLLRQTLPIASLTVAQLEQTLRALAHTAARLIAAAAGGDPALAADGGLGFVFHP